MGKISKVIGSTALACALAAWAGGAQAAARVFTPSATTTVVDDGNGSYTYNVTVTGNSGIGDTELLLDFYLPWLPDMGVSDVHFGSSSDWTYSLAPTDDMFGIHGGAMHFQFYDGDYGYIEGIMSFEAAYGGVEGPYHSVLLDAVTGEDVDIWGDPLIPASPDMLRALSAVPEPTSLAAMLAGLGILAGAARARRCGPQEQTPIA